MDRHSAVSPNRVLFKYYYHFYFSRSLGHSIFSFLSTLPGRVRWRIVVLLMDYCESLSWCEI
jgi:hypothetical protein